MHRVSVAVLDLQDYLVRLASAEPTPGGGSAAAVVGALGAALVAMVGRVTLANPKHSAVHAVASDLVAAADDLRSCFGTARLEDETAYAAVVEAQALPRATDADKAVRSARIQVALAGAAEAPLRLAGLSAELLAACERAAELYNAHMVSDVECALAFGRAALDGSAANVRINHRYLTDAALRNAQVERLSTLMLAAETSEHDVAQIIAAR